MLALIHPSGRRTVPTTAALCTVMMVLGGCGMDDRMLGTPAPGPSTLPTIVPSPTPIPPPLAVADDLLAARDSAPIPQPGALCGVVDTFDTPLAPPIGEGHGVRWPYGRSSRRYGGKIHAGEDWGSQRWRNNLGLPVYSIGHGEVILAQPLGWGRDQGVFIVRHTFEDGSRVLSFYGHLDPPSITLRPGVCVARGDQVGNIGDPRSSPHLHFEIRDHLPGEPGPGYWSTDPSNSGWHAPTEFIRSVRIDTSPGVVWTQSITSPLALAPGFAADGTFVSIEVGPAIVGRAAGDGALAWRSKLPLPANDAVLDIDGRSLYVADRLGIVTAYALPISEDVGSVDEVETSGSGDADAGTSAAAIAAAEAVARAQPVVTWTSDIGRGQAAILAPLPAGGVLVHGVDQLVGLDRSGSQLWAREQVGPPSGWALAGAQLVLAGAQLALGSLPADASGAAIALDPSASVRGVSIDGRPAVVGDAVLIYRPDGIWRVPLGEALTGGGLALAWAGNGTSDMSSALGSGEPRSAALSGLRLMELDPGTFDAGQIVASGANAIIVHRGRSALRLFSLDRDGRLLWDTEISALGRHLPLLMPTDDRLLAATADGDLLELDTDLGTARRLFDGIIADGVGSPPMAAASADGKLAVIQVGGKLVAIDPLAAAEWRTLGSE